MPLADFETWLKGSTTRIPSAEEIIGVVDALRQRMVPLKTSVSGPIVDTCGTGGDGSGTFNISTATAIVVAAVGLPVAKHGNRAVSSKTGSADVLEHLGVCLDIPVEMVAECLANVGICFCYAPAHHPAMAKVGPVRRRVGKPTVFNLVGPLCNPAPVTVQVIGVGRPGAEEAVARAAQLAGLQRAVIVSSEDGIDEVGLFAPTQVIDVSSRECRKLYWTPEDFGIKTASESKRNELLVASAAESAAERRSRKRADILHGAAACVQLLWAARGGPDRAQQSTSCSSARAGRQPRDRDGRLTIEGFDTKCILDIDRLL
jgi:anthranilate phosphoribosyltransferase